MRWEVGRWFLVAFFLALAVLAVSVGWTIPRWITSPAWIVCFTSALCLMMSSLMSLHQETDEPLEGWLFEIGFVVGAVAVFLDGMGILPSGWLIWLVLVEPIVLLVLWALLALAFRFEFTRKEVVHATAD